MESTENIYQWFPPAEAAVPLNTIYKAFADLNKRQPEACFEDLFRISNYKFGGSARSLLFMLLSALSKKERHRRDEVLIPGYTCYSVAAAVVRAGLKISVYDIEPNTFNPDPQSIKQRISERTLAVVSQHLFGMPSDVSELHEIAHSHGAVHIEDAAQAMGGAINSERLGFKGDYGLFSLGRGKPLPLGKGGVLVTALKSKAIDFPSAQEQYGLSEIVKLIMTGLFARPTLYRFVEALPLGLGETDFDPAFRINAMPIFIKQLLFKCMPLLEHFNDHRRHIAALYRERLNPSNLVHEPEGSQCIYTRFPFLAPSVIIAESLKRYGIRRMYPKSLILEEKIHPYISHRDGNTPGANELAKRLITLPTHSMITNETADHICDVLQKKIE